MTQNLLWLLLYTTLPLMSLIAAGLIAGWFVLTSNHYQLLVMVALVAVMSLHQFGEAATFLTSGVVQANHLLEITETSANFLAAGSVYIAAVVTEHRRLQSDNLAALLRFLRHDLRNDLNVTLGCLEAVEAEQSDGAIAERAQTAREMLTRFVRKAERSRLVEQFFRHPPVTQRLALGELLQAEISALQEQNASARISATIPTDVDVLAGAFLEDALHVLLEYAATHSTGDRPLDIQVTERARTVAVTIQLPESDLSSDHWEVCLHGDETDSQHHSVGLGLFFVRTVVQYYDGTIAYQTTDDDTHQITLSLPRPTRRQLAAHALLPKHHHWVFRVSG
ncbi:hypothetical protein SAMN05216388_104125 [Halorientalis persicus]|uniref:Signal transduction histidine kinase n=1 Tax=Halorientalis persicus TaxID=1367881 RepID=A0A1H8VU93_9EURY|nr:HAMP domain-containing histidine kinase [Halorientalis persicus]SEP18498.1 hypothetical protein SAMN05216388_104125 [Halorientalis persicus]